jgi:hypothetical protein
MDHNDMPPAEEILKARSGRNSSIMIDRDRAAMNRLICAVKGNLASSDSSCNRHNLKNSRSLPSLIRLHSVPSKFIDERRQFRSAN